MWRQASLPAVEGGILPPGKNVHLSKRSHFTITFPVATRFRRAGSPGSTSARMADATIFRQAPRDYIFDKLSKATATTPSPRQPGRGLGVRGFELENHRPPPHEPPGSAGVPPASRKPKNRTCRRDASAPRNCATVQGFKARNSVWENSHPAPLLLSGGEGEGENLLSA
jgi:hypothetical protein